MENRKNRLFYKSKKIFFSLLIVFLFSQISLYSQATKFFWEDVKTISKADSRFPITVNSGKKSFILWQEVNISKKEIFLNLKTYVNSEEEREHLHFAGPFKYSGDVPDMFSAAVSKQGTLVVATISAPNEIAIYYSDDSGINFKETKLTSYGTVIAPRIYVTSEDTFKLFVAVGDENTFMMSYADSSYGDYWTNFLPFVPAINLRNPFIPYLIPTEEGDYVIFQAQYSSPEDGSLTYQLYETYKQKFSSSWSAAKLITDENSLLKDDKKSFYTYSNQRPYLINFKGQLYISWERTETINSQMFVAKLNDQGIDRSSVNALSKNGNANRGILFEFLGKLYILWFDTRTGREAVYMAERNEYPYGTVWEESVLVNNKNSNLFAFPVIIPENKKSNKSNLNIIWISQDSKKRNLLSLLSPDKFVKNPKIKALNFKDGKSSANKNPVIQISFPEDNSNIAGYSYTWTKNKLKEPAEQVSHFTNETKLSFKESDSGTYYFAIKIKDYAGNWSSTESISYILDLNPPNRPNLKIPELDEYGFMASNSFKLYWEDSESDDIAGYTYRLDHVASIPKSLSQTKQRNINLSAEEIRQTVKEIKDRYGNIVKRQKKLGSKILTHGNSTNYFINKANGVYVFTVAAVDSVGNIGEGESVLLILNKHQPSTLVTGVSKKTDEIGNIYIDIHGNGFTEDGEIEQITLETYNENNPEKNIQIKSFKIKKDFKLESDSLITGLNLGSDLDEGKYALVLYHTGRGKYKTKGLINVSQTGTIKIEGEYLQAQRYETEKFGLKKNLFIFVIVLCIILIFLLCIFLFWGLVIRKSVGEYYLTQKEVSSIIQGKPMPIKKALEEKEKRQSSLKTKLIRLICIIVVVVVLSVLLVTAVRIVKLQINTSIQSLSSQTEVLMESLSTGVRNFFPVNNEIELSALPEQKNAMSEVEYVTIIGQQYKSGTAENLNYLWASNDKELASKMEDYVLERGVTQITDPKILRISSEISKIDDSISDQIKEISQEISKIAKIAAPLYADFEKNQEELEKLSQADQDLRNKLDLQLNEIAKKNSGSYPEFGSSNFNFKQREYLFYRPVMYREGESGNYVHAIVLLQVSTQKLIENLTNEIIRIFIIGLIIAIFAILAGIIGAYTLASFIVKPIHKLETHVIHIGQTKDKTKLKNQNIQITTKDEIGRLGTAINEMTNELVKVAEEDKLTMDGKAVQKAFLPLDSLEGVRNDKSSIAQLKDKSVECFGYYEGESGVSGDYFDYKKLDDEWFVIIKCDAAGHGIPAAIIMTVVATIFRRYFNTWTYKKNGIELNKLVEQINDFIEQLGLRGKFATLIICLLNTKNGELYMCNAGDRLVHIYDSQTKKIKVISLSSAPTAGVFSSDICKMSGGFVVEKTILKHGDILFLYTDGIEESTRMLRDENFNVVQTKIQIEKMNEKTHEKEMVEKSEDAKEEFGPERVAEIIEAVFTRRKYILTKQDNPMTGEVLEFDFSKCEGSIKDAILALASIEKVFRLYLPPIIPPNSYIVIDRHIDEFLEKCFNRYDFYSANKTENEESQTYVDYNNMLEDDQSDDLTLLAVKRN